jgi:hypothetical protein
MDEAHVEHAVGFVQHQRLHGREVERALLHVVEQAARRGDQDVERAREALDLRLHADTAEDHGRLHRRVLAVDAHDSSTCAASSRVGVRISTLTGRRP